MSINTQIFEAVQSITCVSAVDNLMVYFAEHLVVLVPLSLVYLWFQGRKGKEDSFLTFSSVVTGVVTAYLLGMFYSHQNPSVTYETIVAADPAENAFPSQHTATVFAASFGYLTRKRKKLGIFMVLAAILTGFARVYIGEHWPVDVVGSVIAGLSGIIVAYYGNRFIDALDPVFSFSEKIEKKLPVNLNRF